VKSNVISILVQSLMLCGSLTAHAANAPGTPVNPALNPGAPSNPLLKKVVPSSPLNRQQTQRHGMSPNQVQSIKNVAMAKVRPIQAHFHGHALTQDFCASPDRNAKIVVTLNYSYPVSPGATRLPASLVITTSTRTYGNAVNVVPGAGGIVDSGHVIVYTKSRDICHAHGVRVTLQAARSGDNQYFLPTVLEATPETRERPTWWH